VLDGAGNEAGEAHEQKIHIFEFGSGSSVMPGLVPGIHALSASTNQGVDGPDEPGHDDV
jgi:hypothetical protein